MLEERVLGRPRVSCSQCSLVLTDHDILSHRGPREAIAYREREIAIRELES